MSNKLDKMALALFNATLVTVGFYSMTTFLGIKWTFLLFVFSIIVRFEMEE